MGYTTAKGMHMTILLTIWNKRQRSLKVGWKLLLWKACFFYSLNNAGMMTWISMCMCLCSWINVCTIEFLCLWLRACACLHACFHAHVCDYAWLYACVGVSIISWVRKMFSHFWNFLLSCLNTDSIFQAKCQVVRQYPVSPEAPLCRLLSYPVSRLPNKTHAPSWQDCRSLLHCLLASKPFESSLYALCTYV